MVVFLTVNGAPCCSLTGISITPRHAHAKRGSRARTKLEVTFTMATDDVMPSAVSYNQKPSMIVRASVRCRSASVDRGATETSCHGG
ncbi:unnamed protein product [Lota lota]